MTTDNLSTAGAPGEGAATQNPAPAHGSLWKTGVAAAVVAALALAFLGGWWLSTKPNKRSARSSDVDSSSEQDRREVGGSSGAHGKVQLWEDGPYWAETNIGAENPEDYGYYFWWGDTVGYKWDGDVWVTSDGAARNFLFNYETTPSYRKNTDELKGEGWITKDGVLAPKYDAAHVHWGGEWRMPTRQEQEGLVCGCDWIWTTKKGVEGYIVRGRGKYASASIFLPAAGYGFGTSLCNAGSLGYYFCSSDPCSNDNRLSSCIYFSSRSHFTHYGRRDLGQSVRPVQGVPQKRTK